MASAPEYYRTDAAASQSRACQALP